MPKFDLIPVGEAMIKFGTGRGAQITSEYLGYIEQLTGQQAGRLQVAEGETIATLRRRLGADDDRQSILIHGVSLVQRKACQGIGEGGCLCGSC